ncbi:electron transport complex subunit RsxB [Geobacter sp. OR-1]|uniref:ATP-binding protein n=1 Tax=Geobacter sp. OR-1 TaxID=1266765 RepID=UPI0005430713|nr:4Fe-4S binding protein [Geobacter sp. OR-1]GAM09109.1 electron transport complex subunit RsxB [Geobacter sp. OR-1]
MPDSSNLTGSRDDLRIDRSRCLRMRFSDSGCRRCLDICPNGAVSLDDGLSINSKQCRGCLLCTAVCPAGALEQGSDFSACLAQLSRVPEPVLGCVRTNECSHATMACLGSLSEEHLFALCHALDGRLTLNLSQCGDCPNSAMLAILAQRLNTLSASGLSDEGCCIVLAESAQDIKCRAESVDRRSFFRSFGKVLLQNAAVILSNTREQTEQRTDYTGKRLPMRRELLNRTRSRLSLELELLVRTHFDTCVSFDNSSCTGCQGCVAICPTGALMTGVMDEKPVFDYLLCTGCGLCREFCLDHAVRVTPRAGL